MLTLQEPKPYELKKKVDWLSEDTYALRISHLILTQRYLDLSIVLDQDYSRKDLIEVVKYNGKFYVDNGHHRVIRAALAGSEFIRAHVLTLE